MLTLRVIHPGRGEQPHTFDSCDVTLGRSPDCDVTLDDPYLSSRHVRIQVGVVVSDLGSKNGVWVDGSRVEGPTVVTGKSLHLGSHRSDRPYVDVSLEGWLGDGGGALLEMTEERDRLLRRCEELEGMKAGLLQELQGLRNSLEAAGNRSPSEPGGTRALVEDQTLMLGGDLDLGAPSSDGSGQGVDGDSGLAGTAIEPVPANIPEDDDSRLDLNADGDVPTLIGGAAFGDAGFASPDPKESEVQPGSEESEGNPGGPSPGLPDFAAFFGGADGGAQAPAGAVAGPSGDGSPPGGTPQEGGEGALGTPTEAKDSPPSFTQFFGSKPSGNGGSKPLGNGGAKPLGNGGAPTPQGADSDRTQPATPIPSPVPGPSSAPGGSVPEASLSAEEIYMRALRGEGAPGSSGHSGVPSPSPPAIPEVPGDGGAALPGSNFNSSSPIPRNAGGEAASPRVDLGPHLARALSGGAMTEQALDSGSAEDLLALGALELATDLEGWIDGVAQGVGPGEERPPRGRPSISPTFELLDRLATRPGDPQRRKELVDGFQRLGRRARETALAYRQAGVELCREVRRDPGGPLTRSEGGTAWDDVRRKLDGYASDALGGGTRAE